MQTHAELRAGHYAVSEQMPRVLCPQLYRRLQQLAGRVEIVDRGAAFVYEDVWNMQVSPPRLQRVIRSHGESYRVNCPFCRETRRRLWISHAFGQFDNSNYRMIHLAKCFNDTACMDRRDNRVALCDFIYGFQNRADRDAVFECLPAEYEEPEIREVGLPGDCVPLQNLPSDHQAIRYMVGQRGYALDFLVRMGCTFCVRADPRWRQAEGRVIAPIVMNGILCGWQGRWPDDLDWKAAGFPKYFTLPGMPKRQILYNFDSAKQYPFVIVEEGITDVWATGPFAVGLLGSSLSWPQQRALRVQWAGLPIIVMLDGGDNELCLMQHMVEELTSGQQQRSPVCYVRLPEGRDPGSYQGYQANLLDIVRAQTALSGIRLPI
jgi:hypothetical protein